MTDQIPTSHIRSVQPTFATSAQIAKLAAKTPAKHIGTLAGRMNKKTSRKSPDMSYITARYAMDTADAAVGAEHWAIDFRRDHTNRLYVGVGILTESGWVWKWDTGEESSIEPGKGEFSDSLKRAFVQWGVGRDLYPSANKATAKSEPATTAKTKDAELVVQLEDEVVTATKATKVKRVRTTKKAVEDEDPEAEVVGQTGLTTKQKAKMFATLRDAGVPDDKRKALVHTITGKTSTTKMTNEDLDTVLAFAEGGEWSEEED